MKVILSILLILCLVGFISIIITSILDEPSLNKGQLKAISLYIPITCNDEPAGTGFPVDHNLVMTAKHVFCQVGEVPKMSFDGGLTWKVEKEWMFNKDADVAIIQVDDFVFTEYAKFRLPVLSEETSGYGIADDGLLTHGVITHIGEYFLSDAQPVGGMSGSAVVGNDGMVIGMCNYALPDEYHGATETGGYRGDTLKGLVKSYKQHKLQEEWK